MADPGEVASEGLEEAAPPTANGRRGAPWRRTHHWTRWLHTYTSMIALLLVLFFGFTGITLNHPEWTLGFDPTTTTFEGTLPTGWRTDQGTVEFLQVSEYLREEYGVKGAVADFGSDAAGGFISYRSPGYGADIKFDLDSGAYLLTVDQQGWVGVLNDLHKGRDADSSWAWVIDLSGGILVVIAVTGLGLQLFLKKRRRSALLVALAGVVVTIVFTMIAIT